MTLDFANVQGLVRHGYGRCDAARFVPLSISDAVRARAWLGELLRGDHGPSLRDARAAPERGDVCINVALTHAGLQRLGLDPQVLAQFSRPFQEGMAGDAQRSRALGDRGESDPERWRWGGPHNPTPHVLLLVYAGAAGIADAYARCLARWQAHGLAQVAQLAPAQNLPGYREHFGFVDGIAQPQVEGLDDDARPERWDGNRIRLGEVLLGYPNEYGQLTERPLIGAESDPARTLPSDLGGSGKRDFARDGTYLVFRQLRQDVSAWWRALDEATGGRAGESPEAMVALAAKMVGRWPDGAPLVEPEAGQGVRATERDGFDYARDPHGLGCPLGAHVRRANPRGSILPEHGGPSTREQARALGRRHRIVRRGRAFGPPLAAAMTPEALRAAAPDQAERGLHFLCVGANIARQFEFVQQAWLLSRKFQGLYDEADPLLGEHGRDGATSFGAPALPVRRRYALEQRFVSTLGGAYLFLPSLAALRYLAGRT